PASAGRTKPNGCAKRFIRLKNVHRLIRGQIGAVYRVGYLAHGFNTEKIGPRRREPLQLTKRPAGFDPQTSRTGNNIGRPVPASEAIVQPTVDYRARVAMPPL